MRIVEDGSGRSYVVVKTADEASLVRDIASGEEEYLPNTEITEVDGVAPLESAALQVPEAVRRVVGAVHADWNLGLLLELYREEFLTVGAMASQYTVCESDLHGALAEFEAAGLIEEGEVGGERGYGLTKSGLEGVEALIRE